MSTREFKLTRRSLLKGMAGVLGTTALGPFPAGSALAAKFPSHNIRVTIPTREGGGIDRACRAFSSVWRRHLGTNFILAYYPGASGQVAYETYIRKRKADGYNLLFGNIGPEMIMYATQKTSYEYLKDYIYFASIDVDDAVIWVGKNTKFKTIEDLVNEGKKRRVNISTSRLPHPASLGVLSLAEATGAKFKLIPYGGGSPARSAAITGEVDACATFMNSSLSVKDQVRFLTVFQKKNRLPGITNNAPPVNQVFNTQIPSLTGSRAWAIHTKAIKKYPDRFQFLKKTSKAAFKDPAYRKAVEKARIRWEFIEYGDESVCRQTAQQVVALARKYKPLITGSKK